VPLISELKRRNVFRAAAVYAVVAWLLIQIVATIEEPLGLPQWFDTAIIVLLAVGFPLVVVLSWAFELTPEGIKPSVDVPVAESITRRTGQKLNVAIIVALSLAVIFLVVDNYVLESPSTESAAPQDRHSIAALPFSNESAAQEDAEFLANGLHDEVLTQLAKIHSLKVISRTSVEAYRDAARNLREIGQELGVANILEGRVQRAGNMLRINVQLIDAATDEHLWAETYDRELSAENIFAVQAEMAAAIADALEATLTPEERAQINAVPTTNTRAYNFYLSGKEYRRAPVDENNFSLAAQQLQRAVDEDPQFALAWAELAGAHLDMYWFGEDRAPARRDRARAAIERAFAITPDLPEAHLAMAEYHYHGFRDYERALAELEIAAPGVSENSSYFLNRGSIHRRLGNWQPAIADFARALELDPRSASILVESGNTYEMQRDYATAESFYRRAAELLPDRPPFELAELAFERDGDVGLNKEILARIGEGYGRYGVFFGWSTAMIGREYDSALGYLGRADQDTFEAGPFYFSVPGARGITLVFMGRTQAASEQLAEARRQLEATIAALGDPEPEHNRFSLMLAIVAAYAGDSDAAIAAADRALALLPPSRDAMLGQELKREVAMRVLVPLGEIDRAIALLDDYLSSAGGSWSIQAVIAGPWLDSIRDDPRYRAFVERHRTG